MESVIYPNQVGGHGHLEIWTGKPGVVFKPLSPKEFAVYHMLQRQAKKEQVLKTNGAHHEDQKEEDVVLNGNGVKHDEEAVSVVFQNSDSDQDFMQHAMRMSEGRLAGKQSPLHVFPTHDPPLGAEWLTKFMAEYHGVYKRTCIKLDCQPGSDGVSKPIWDWTEVDPGYLIDQMLTPSRFMIAHPDAAEKNGLRKSLARNYYHTNSLKQQQPNGKTDHETQPNPNGNDSDNKNSHRPHLQTPSKNRATKSNGVGIPTNALSRSDSLPSPLSRYILSSLPFGLSWDEEWLSSLSDEDQEWVLQFFDLRSRHVVYRFPHHKYQHGQHHNHTHNHSHLHQNPLFIALEDVNSNLRMPCVADIKVGTRHYEDDASLAKKSKHLHKAITTTTAELGFRFSGMQMYSEEEHQLVVIPAGAQRKLTKEQIPAELCRFFSNGKQMHSEIIQEVVIKLEELLYYIRNSSWFRFYSCSILICYEGDSNQPLEMGSKRPVMVRLIDFAHSTLSFGHVDNCFEFGLVNLIKYLKDLFS
eukprot:CAMPEP_0184706440 /NCGR_PEP_ID=MMETSP0313-20130426/36760_1 /TAXON_ID=2792 /ORGANISM="Porphyridium aerugineum, Strain SAG 1380-2" /LENGTH=525 /DNA_ID=CAMNT_0027167993 /DNA_START=110 /DNA_END=1687 /DNA_ORIENTATION=-